MIVNTVSKPARFRGGVGLAGCNYVDAMPTDVRTKDYDEACDADARIGSDT